MLGEINIRAFGSERDLKKFLDDIKQLYGNVLASRILPNTRPTDVHSHRVLLTIAIRPSVPSVERVQR